MRIELNKKDYVILLISGIILVSLCIFVYLLLNVNNSSLKIKDKKVNHYDRIYITNDKQASIYLNRYYNLINDNVKEAYKLLDDETKEKYKSIDLFKNYITTLDLSNTKISKFRVVSKGEYYLYDIYDGNNNHIQFKEKSVMRYSVSIP